MKQKNKDQVIDSKDVAQEEEPGRDQVSQNKTDILADESFESNDNESKLSAEIRECQDKYLRLSAEFDNYRKRTLKEKMELIQTGGEDFVRSILPVADDFDRAMDAMDMTEDIESIREGVRLIKIKFTDALRQKGVTEIESLDCAFDTDQHDAVAKFPVDDASRKGKIVDVVQKGYKMNDKVIRFAKVVVGE